MRDDLNHIWYSLILGQVCNNIRGVKFGVHEESSARPLRPKNPSSRTIESRCLSFCVERGATGPASILKCPDQRPSTKYNCYAVSSTYLNHKTLTKSPTGITQINLNNCPIHIFYFMGSSPAGCIKKTKGLAGGARRNRYQLEQKQRRIIKNLWKVKSTGLIRWNRGWWCFLQHHQIGKDIASFYLLLFNNIFLW